MFDSLNLQTASHSITSAIIIRHLPHFHYQTPHKVYNKTNLNFNPLRFFFITPVSHRDEACGVRGRNKGDVSDVHAVSVDTNESVNKGQTDPFVALRESTE